LGVTINLNLLRAIGILLVTNSHFDALYPDPRMGVGGALGNAIFFALSGYGLACSHRSQGRGFFTWYWRRIARIFPSVWIVAAITMTVYGLWGAVTPASFLGEFVWPTRHWFVSAMMLFYLIFFFILSSCQARAFELLAALLMLPYAIGYFWFIDLGRWSLESGYFKWIFYGQIMLLGAALAHRQDWMIASDWRREVLLFVILFAGYLAFKLVMGATGFWQAQGILHLMTLPMVLLAFRAGAALPVQRWTECARLGRVATFISLISFEIYLTQHLFHGNAWLQSLPFPIGAVLALAGTLALAAVVMRLAHVVRATMQRLAAIAGLSAAQAAP
jgi:peptidoglycan/LPS O-acetylase OafA/YrhL